MAGRARNMNLRSYKIPSKKYKTLREVVIDLDQYIMDGKLSQHRAYRILSCLVRAGTYTELTMRDQFCLEIQKNGDA